MDIPTELVDAIAERVAAKLAAPASEPWLDVAGAAEYLACPTSRIYDLVAKKQLEVRRDGRRVLTRREWLDAAVGGRE